MSAWLLNFASHSQETVNFNAGAFSGANVTVHFYIIPKDFKFLIESIKALYDISYYFFMYFKTFLIKLRLTHSAGLMIVNKDMPQSLFFWLLLHDCLRESLNINYKKALNVWSLGKLVSFVFPWVLIFPLTSSRETSGLSEKQNCFHQDHTSRVRYGFKMFTNWPYCQQDLCKMACWQYAHNSFLVTFNSNNNMLILQRSSHM